MFRPWESQPTSSASKNENRDEHYYTDSDEWTDNDDTDLYEDDTNTPPVKRKRIHLNDQAKQICLNVYNNLLKIKDPNDQRSIIREAADLTDVPYRTMCKLVKNGIVTRKRRSDAGKAKELDLIKTKLLRSTVYDFYKNNEIPTVEMVFRKLNERQYDIVCCRNTLRNWLKKIGFRFKTINKRVAIMESKRIVEWRCLYLEAIKKYRNENKPIYFLDETWYDTHDTAKKGWTDGTKNCQVTALPPNKGTRLVILHCGSSDGWVNDGLKLCGKKMENCNVDYHQNMESQIFEEWFENSLIPNLKPNSVIVMDNAPYHSRQLTKIPNTSSRKSDIQDFLREHDLYYEEHYNKKQLLEVLRTKKFEKIYAVDEMAKKHGHTVLRLPPYFCIFNPIELIWGQLKKRIRRKNSFPKFDNKVVDLIREECSKIGSEDWRKKIEKVSEYENYYRSLHDTVTKNGSEQFIITVGENSDSDCEFGDDSELC